MDDRLPKPLQRCTVLMVATVLLQHLDLIAVRIFDEEKPRHQCALVHEFLHFIGIEAFRLEPSVDGVEIVYHESEVTIPLAV